MSCNGNGVGQKKWIANRTSDTLHLGSKGVPVYPSRDALPPSAGPNRVCKRKATRAIVICDCEQSPLWKLVDEYLTSCSQAPRRHPGAFKKHPIARSLPLDPFDCKAMTKELHLHRTIPFAPIETRREIYYKWCAHTHTLPDGTRTPHSAAWKAISSVPCSVFVWALLFSSLFPV